MGCNLWHKRVREVVASKEVLDKYQLSRMAPQ